MSELNIWTDGGYCISKGVGAYAYIILDGRKEVMRHAERVVHSTNNRCELMAIIEAVRKLPYGSVVCVNTDSQYCIGVLSGEYKRKKNVDLLGEWDALLRDKGLSVSFNWVKGHSGLRYNEMCDSMCNEAAGCNLNEYRLYFKKK